MAALAALLVGLGACGPSSASDEGPVPTAAAPRSSDLRGSTADSTTGITSPSPTDGTTVDPEAADPDTGDVVGFGLATVRLLDPDGDAQVLVVALADTDERRRRGLMGVRDLGDLDGMLFVSEAPTATGFWMKDTQIALDVAFFAPDPAGDLVLLGVVTMTPCEASPCPVYPAPGPWTHALEVPAGSVVFEPEARLVVGR